MNCQLTSWMTRLFWLLAIVLWHSDVKAEDSLKAMAESLPATLILGKVTSDPRKSLLKYHGLSELLAKTLAPYGVKKVKLHFEVKLQDMVFAARNGKVDFFLDSTYPAAKLKRDTAMQPLLVDSLPEGFEYRSLFAVRKDSDVHSLQDLLGQSIAFEDENSTGSYFLPALELQEHGIKLSNSHMAPEHVYYQFAGEEINIAQWLLSGKVTAGAFSTKDWVQPDRVPPKIKAKLRIIYRSRPITPKYFMISDKFTAPMQKRIADALVNIKIDENSNFSMRWLAEKQLKEASDREKALLSEMADSI